MKELKKVLIISYYWPPSGGAGVQRWLKTTKYLREFGWEPVIYTPENPESPALDESLNKEIPEGIEVIKTKIWEPYTLYQKLAGKKKNHSSYISTKKKKGFVAKLSEWIRANVIIPDPRVYWVRPSVKHLNTYLKTHKIDAMVSTGPPHSMHLIALGVKKKHNIPWIADFRDPWTFIDFHHHLPFTDRTKKKHKKLEESVVRKADARTIVSPSWLNTYEELYAEKFNLIYNGYDTADFPPTEKITLDKCFSICHIGSLNIDRNPKAFWEVLKELVEESEEFKKHLKIKLIGIVNPETLAILEKLGLNDQLEHIKYIAHNDIVKVIRKVQLLLLLINDAPNVAGIIPGKIYEYLASGRPTLAIGTDLSDSVKIINETNSGVVIERNDKEELKSYIKESFQKYLNGNLYCESKNIEKFTRKKQTSQFADILNQITSNGK